MATLTKAHRELYARSPDECFDSLQSLWEHCHRRKQESLDRWTASQDLRVCPSDNLLGLNAGTDGAFLLNDWSFTQLCKIAGVGKDTVNRLSPETAAQVFAETLPRSAKPMQLLTKEQSVRSLHGVSYTRLWDVDLVTTLREFAVDFQPPQKAITGGTGLYAGEQDVFAFLIDPTGWAEIGGEAFAPGFFVWNSEVGKRSVGISTFWFQAVCQNHIVWDATEVTEFTRKHTASVHDSLGEIRRMIEALVQKRDERKDGFVKLMKKAMETTLGQDADEVEKVLAKQGITKSLAKRALEIAMEKGRFTVWCILDALTRLTQELENAGDRTEADQKVSRLLALAA